MPLLVPIEVVASAEGRCTRRREPVTLGVPAPKGAYRDGDPIALSDSCGHPIGTQVRILDRWSDRSARWLLVDFQADHDASDRPSRYTLASNADESSSAAGAGIVTTQGDGQLIVDTRAARFAFGCEHGRFPFEAVTVGGLSAIDAGRSGFALEDAQGRLWPFETSRIEIEEPGPLRAAVRVDGWAGPSPDEPIVRLAARLHFFAGSATVRFQLTMLNPRRAKHPGGLWELGDEGSIEMRHASFVVALPPTADPIDRGCSPEIGAAFEQSAEPLELYQDSSGGANWKSANHVDGRGVVPLTFRGYRWRRGDVQRAGLRATPLVTMSRASQQVSVAMPQFWQNFPKAIEANGDTLTVGLFPRQHAAPHELQAGEQKTHVFCVAFGRDVVSDAPLDWTRTPLLARATPVHYCGSHAVPYLLPWDDEPHSEYRQLVGAAVDGTDGWFAKREIIDEYGWRNFGDLYADHEAVFHDGAQPLVSHYNNQYDAIAGLAVQFMRTGDVRWWSLFTDLAAHVVDIDLYHTERDKSAYNHGLFWHTAHYVDARRSTHRSYPLTPGVCGGGPSSEHNYSAGLLLHHFLTGNQSSRDAVIDLANWVVDMDDGDKTVFRWVSRGDTGLASATAERQAPGRGAGNSIAVLLDGHRLTGERRFLDKAEALVRRVAHSEDAIDSVGLLDVERRWSYTVFLHALGRYLDYKIELGEPDAMYAYARDTLLAYARWMVKHERPYLDHPEQLEYPTETWAAQEMWKSEVFDFAARHARDVERARVLERADFFFRCATTTLTGMNTRTLTRPVVLLLSHGYMRAWMIRHLDALGIVAPLAPADRRPRSVFIPQKLRAKNRVRALALAGAAAAVVLVIAHWLERRSR